MNHQQIVTTHIIEYLKYFNRTNRSEDYNFLFTLDLDNYIKHRKLFTIYDLINDLYIAFSELYPDILQVSYPDKNKNYSFFTRSLLVYGLKNKLQLLSQIDLSENTKIFVGKDNNGTLSKSSKNCIHSLLKLTKISDRSKKIFFIKIIEFENENIDLLIFDIINGIYFNTILATLTQLSKFVPKYKYSFLSYYYGLSSYNLMWSYNTFINKSSNYFSSIFHF